MWIASPDHHPGDTCVNQGLSTGRRSTHEGAWFQRDIDGGTGNVSAGIGNGVYLGMGFASSLVISTADNCTVSNDYAANRRIRCAGITTKGSQFQGCSDKEGI
jgi:hypothetical protein